MKKLFVLFLLIMLLFYFTNCQTKETTVNTNTGQPAYNVQEATIAIEKMGPAFAQAILTDSILTSMITTETGKMFDGDYDMLFNTVKEKKTASKDFASVSFKEAVAAKYNKISKNRANAPTFDQLLDSVPNLNLFFYVPDNMDRTEAIPQMVVCMDYTIDDLALKTLKAYDLNGNEIILDVTTKSDVPAIVLGINERTDINGNVIYSDPSETRAGAVGDGDYIYLDKVTLIHDQEIFSLFSITYAKMDIAFNNTTEVDVQLDPDGTISDDYFLTNHLSIGIEGKVTAELNGNGTFGTIYFTTDDDLYDDFYVYACDMLGREYLGGNIKFMLNAN